MAAKIVTVGEGRFEELVEGHAEGVVEVMRAARALVGAVLPGVTEVVWPRQGNAGYGVGPKKMSEHFCYIAGNKAHVNLGFFYGADLEDPAGLLEGSGKSLRHVKLRSLADVERPELRALVEAAKGHLPKL